MILSEIEGNGGGVVRKEPALRKLLSFPLNTLRIFRFMWIVRKKRSASTVAPRSSIGTRAASFPLKRSSFERHVNQHGWQGPLDGPCLYRRVTEKRSVEGCVTESIQFNVGVKKRTSMKLQVSA